jgi:ribosomal protein L32
LGYLIDKARHAKMRHTADDLDVVLLIRCKNQEQIEQAEHICRSYHVTYIGHDIHASGGESV